MEEKIQKLRDLKILFVEDEDDLLSIITEALRKLQANYITAKDGKEGLEIVKNDPDIDVVVTDINMPNMNGLEMIENIQKIRKDIPFIIMTAHTETEYISQAKELGVEDYLLKPFDFINFIELITDIDLNYN
ncbi:MAG: response regulator [Campylobacterota bacterium]